MDASLTRIFASGWSCGPSAPLPACLTARSLGRIVAVRWIRELPGRLLVRSGSRSVVVDVRRARRFGGANGSTVLFSWRLFNLGISATGYARHQSRARDPRGKRVIHSSVRCGSTSHGVDNHTRMKTRLSRHQRHMQTY
jgi:hypothetical protein